MKKAKKKPSAMALARASKTKLAKRGVSVDRAGHARKGGRLLSAAQVRRAVAAVKRAFAPKKKAAPARKPAAKPAPKKAVRTTARKAQPKKVAPPPRAIAKRPVATKRPIAKPVRKAAPTKKTKPARKPARPIAKAAPSRAARARAEERRLAREAAERKERRAAKKRADARRERALEKQRAIVQQLREQERLTRKLARQQRAAQKETAQLREALAKLTTLPAPAPQAPTPPAAPTPPRAAPPAPPAPPATPLTDIEQLEADVAREEAERARTRAPAAPTPFEIMVNDAIRRGEPLTPEAIRQLQIAAAASAETPAGEATDADYAIANAYSNLVQGEQMAWARARDSAGQPRLTEAAKRIIREHAIEKAIEHRNIRTLIDMRKSPIFNDDLQVRQMMRTLGPLDGRKSIPFQEARDLILDYLRSKDKYASYKDEINAFLASVRPTSDQIQDAIKDAKTDIERQKILEELIPELAKRHPQLDIRELWAMAKSPQYVAVVI